MKIITRNNGENTIDTEKYRIIIGATVLYIGPRNSKYNYIEFKNMKHIIDIIFNEKHFFDEDLLNKQMDSLIKLRAFL